MYFFFFQKALKRVQFRCWRTICAMAQRSHSFVHLHRIAAKIPECMISVTFVMVILQISHCFFRNFVRRELTSKQSKRPASRESYFKFRQMNSAINPYVRHFQLRNLITATSQSDVYYASRFHVCHTDGQRVRNAMDLTPASTTWPLPRALSITCLGSSSDVLVVGGFTGEYALKHLGSEIDAPIVQGFLTHDSNGITNHVHTFNNRNSNQTQVAFCSNDRRLRLLDCHTNTITSTFAYPKAINCSTTSPDGRLRVLVGDGRSAFLTNADSGQPLAKFSVHTEDIFACAWSPDGLLLATAAQDSEVVIFDARRWDRPLAALPTSLSCARSLRFSPAGSGKRLLFVAEANDFVNVIDATTFETCQTLDFFGAIGGIALTPEGDSLYVANCDPNFGGLMQYEAMPAYSSGIVAEPFERVYSAAATGAYSRGGWGRKLDWFSERELAMEDPARRERRFRRGLGLEKLMV
jgi:DNA-binding beta-propeller fold protein YncE